MALTPSTMMPLGTEAPDFRLPDFDGRQVARDDFADAQALLVMFICNHCPFVQHVREELARFGREYLEKGLAIVAISSNDIGSHPQDGPEGMKQEAEAAGYTFPYLYDEDQEVAKAYQAACTPDFFLFDGDRRLVYRGQLDDSRPGNDMPVSGQDLRTSTEMVLAGLTVRSDQKPSIGCNIKWKPGNEPDYFSRS